MLSIVCKHWQISAEEFGRIFNVPEPDVEKILSGQGTLPHHTYERFTRVIQTAESITGDGDVAAALRQYQEDNGLNLVDVANKLGMERDSVRRWVREEAAPKRNSLLKIAAMINQSPIEEEWMYEMEGFRRHSKILGISQSWLAKQLESSTPTVNQWINGKTVPRKATIERWLPWVRRFNENAKILSEGVLDIPPKDNQ